MTEPVVLRVSRPYADEAAYLAAESWTIDDKAVVLIDQPALPRDTIVRFEIVLDDGSKPVRAEGKVHKLIAADGDHPGGLRVRFSRFDASTKRFIDRVLEERRQARRSKRPPPTALAPLVLDPEPVTGSDGALSERAPAPAEQSAPEQSAPEVVSRPVTPTAEATTPEPAEVEADAPPRQARAPGDRRGPRTVQPPPGRDALLEKLRARAKASGAR